MMNGGTGMVGLIMVILMIGGVPRRLGITGTRHRGPGILRFLGLPLL